MTVGGWEEILGFGDERIMAVDHTEITKKIVKDKLIIY